MSDKSLVEYGATGRRKEAVACVRLTEGDGKIIVNGQSFEEYYPLASVRLVVQQPLILTGCLNSYNIIAKVSGGGKIGQAGAMRHGIARALLKIDEKKKGVLRSHGCLTRDPRMKERKKSGQPGARRRFQFSKR